MIVIDDLLEALSRQKVAMAAPANKVTVTYNPGDSEDFKKKLEEVQVLRKSGTPAELVPGTER